MNLKCKIHGKEFPIVQGVTFSEEYNETLDSGSLIITHVSKIRKLRPYNDVFVFDNEFNGFGENLNPRANNKFYKHMLVQNFTEEILNLKDKIYKYKISLMSEIKALEKVQLPNISVTQPLEADFKVSVYEYLVRFVKMYSPKYKRVIKGTNKWEYVQKYTVDPKLEEIFGNVYSPDFTLNLPTLRDLLSKLMVVKDMIPYVEDNVIKAMDITARKKEFVLDEAHMNYITGTMNNEDYCTGLRRTYSDALSQDSTCRSVEYMGFRNNDSALMTLGNMRLETRFPIYKINKVLMCYYKESAVKKKLSNGEKQSYFFLCKQDITKLVKLNTERNVLSKDWYDFKEFMPISLDELAQYKIATLGYDIGSKYITGWGESYTYPKGWWLTEKNTYIENILNTIDIINENGIYQYDTLLSKLNDNNVDNYIIDESKDVFQTIITPFTTKLEDIVGDIVEGTPGTELLNLNFASAVDMKGLFFIVDYQGFYNGAIETSKDNIEDDEIISNDNSSSSLALLELDGLSQKEKVNRFGNKTIQISARYEDISQMQNLGDVYNNEDDTDVIIYHREYSIYDNLVNCIYFGVKDYVLKNYYTSVFARHRTWNLIPYSESVVRAENKKYILSLSKNESYYEKNDGFNIMPISDIFSCFEESEKLTTYDYYESSRKINYGYISHNNNYFATEVNSFLNGYSLCFNLKTLDNISMGNYISKASPFVGKTYDGEKWEKQTRKWLLTNDDYTGSKQDWYSIVDNIKTGFTKKMGFYLGHYDKELEYSYLTEMIGKNNYFMPNYKTLVDNVYLNKLFILPKINESVVSEISNKTGQDFEIHKDNKEIIDMTYQIEPISLDENVIFSPWLMKLSELLSNYYKLENNKVYNFNNFETFPEYAATATFLSGFIEYRTYGLIQSGPKIILQLSPKEKEKIFSAFYYNKKIKIVLEKSESFVYDRDKGTADSLTSWAEDYNVITYLKWTPKEINSIYINKDNKVSILINVEQELELKLLGQPSKIVLSNELIELNQIEEYYGEPLNPNMLWFEYDFKNITYTDNSGTITNFGENKDTYILLENNYNVTACDIVSKEDIEKWRNDSAIVSANVSVEKTYYKNMYVLLSSEKLKNTLVYDEYEQENLPSSYSVSNAQVSDVFTVNSNTININLNAIKYKNFVFNDIIQTTDVINPPASDTDDSYEKIYLYCNFTTEEGVKYDMIFLAYDSYNGLQMYYREKETQKTINVYNQETGWEDNKYKLLKTGITYDVSNELNEYTEEEFKKWENLNTTKTKQDISDIKSIQYWFKEIKETTNETSLEFFEFKKTLTISPLDLNDKNFNIHTEANYGTYYGTYVDFSFCDNMGMLYKRINLNVFEDAEGKIYPLEVSYTTINGDLKQVYKENSWVKPEYQTITRIDFTNFKSIYISEELFKKWLIDNAQLLQTTPSNKNLMKFVFGVNLTDEDKEKDSIKIYTSLISNRNPNVYDENYNIVGKIHNYANNEDFTYGEDQYYDEEDID